MLETGRAVLDVPSSTGFPLEVMTLTDAPLSVRCPFDVLKSTMAVEGRKCIRVDVVVLRRGLPPARVDVVILDVVVVSALPN